MSARPVSLVGGCVDEHLERVLGATDGNRWFRKLVDGMQELSTALGDKYPMGNALMRGPGDMLGALMGHQQFVLDAAMHRDPDRLVRALGACTEMWIRAADAQLDAERPFDGGHCCNYMLWAPGRHILLQDDIASLLSPTLYRELLVPAHLRILRSFPYATFHMHSGALGVYAWEDYVGRGERVCLQVSLDPAGKALPDLMDELVKMNEMAPLILSPCTLEQQRFVEEHLGTFPGSVLVCSAVEYSLGFADYKEQLATEDPSLPSRVR